MNSKPIKILLIEDNPGDARYLQELLADVKSNPSVLMRASLLSEGLELLSRAEFDIILLDLSLPDSSGLETFSSVSTHARNVPIVVLSGLNDELTALKAVQSGAQDYLVKGQVGSDLLARSIRYAIERRQILTKLEHKSRALSASEARFRSLAETANDPIISINSNGGIIFWNNAAEQMFGYVSTEVEGKAFTVLFPERFKKKYEKTFDLVVSKGKAENIKNTAELCGVRKDASEFPLELSLAAWQKEREMYFTAIIRNITEQKRAEERLREEKNIAKSYFEIAGTMLVVIKANQIVEQINKKGCEIIGCVKEEIVGKNWFDSFVPSRIRETLKSSFDSLMSGKIKPEEHRENLILNRRGEERIITWNHAVLRKENGKIIAVLNSGQDITEIKAAQKKIKRLAYYDSLTDIPNRVLFNETLKQELSRASRNNEKIALMLLDLDNFKNTNDTMGHDVGDKLLQSVTWRLKSCLRKYDSIARLGGDEFTILLPQIDKHPEDTEKLASRFVNVFRESINVGSHKIDITPSIGIAVYPKDGDNVQTLMKNADIAMYKAKKHGKNKYSFYNADMSTRSIERMEMENRLYRALERNEFSLEYQPQMELKTGEVVGVEALLRWNSPEFGKVSPKHFIPVIEETGLILSVGEWVIKTACQQSKFWQDSGCPPVVVSVNLSARQFFKQNICEIALGILKDVGLEPKWLEFEVTESETMDDSSGCIEILSKLRENGINVSLDDFGTGYSSLSYLRHLPIDKLKIDCSFVRNIADSKKDADIAEAIIKMAHTLGLKVVGEGVEIQEQLDILREIDCDIIQGFLLAKPIEHDKVPPFLAAKNIFAAYN